MTNAIRWTPERYAEHMAQRVAKAQAECDRILGVPVKSDPVPAAPPAAPKKRSKYGSRKVVEDGETFDSEKELRRWRQLKLLADEGHITDLQRQVAFVLAPAVKLKGEARTKPALRYIADAVYVLNGELIIEDVKSAPTRKLPAYRDRKHLMKTVLNLDITEI